MLEQQLKLIKKFLERIDELEKRSDRLEVEVMLLQLKLNEAIAEKKL